ncbi:hypothetical protein [Bradyrhizobium sp. USDA 4353]
MRLVNGGFAPRRISVVRIVGRGALARNFRRPGQRSIVPALGAPGLVYMNAKTMRLEHNTAVLTAARARKPPENRSWCRMGHLLRPDSRSELAGSFDRRPGSEIMQLQANPEGSLS